MRTIKELLILMKDKYKDYKSEIFITGLCSIIPFLHLTTEEEIMLSHYIRYHHPNIKHYYTYNDESTNDSDLFWYKISDRLNRYKWLNKHIKLNS